jgi:ABC-type polar amino acid transport system ATPase subunit
MGVRQMSVNWHVRGAFSVFFQRFNLFPHLTATENVALGPRRVLGMSPAEAEARAIKQLTRVRLADHLHKRPSQLSCGKQQRVAIARARHGTFHHPV